jgi:hypothetical protein
MQIAAGTFGNCRPNPKKVNKLRRGYIDPDGVKRLNETVIKHLTHPIPTVDKIW